MPPMPVDASPAIAHRHSPLTKGDTGSQAPILIRSVAQDKPTPGQRLAHARLILPWASVAGKTVTQGDGDDHTASAGA